MRYLETRSRTRTELLDITADVQELLKNSGIRNGVCHLFVLHTTAGVTVNEGADPSVRRDMTDFFNSLVPADYGFTHAEGNSDAHIKASLVGTSQTIPIIGNKLLLGTWQALYLCEFDGPRTRKIAVMLMPDS